MPSDDPGMGLGITIHDTGMRIGPDIHNYCLGQSVQQQSTAMVTPLGAVQRRFSELNERQRGSPMAKPSLCRARGYASTRQTAFEGIAYASRLGGPSLSFSLIRDRSAGFMIGCHACNRRLAVGPED